MQLQPPIFVFAHDPASFDSLDALVRYVEPVDVDGEVQVFDSLGHELALRSVNVARNRLVVGGGKLEIIDVGRTEESIQRFSGLLRSCAVELQQHLGTRWEADLDVATVALSSLVEAVHPWTRTT